MKEPVRPDARAAASRVRDLAVDLATDLAEGYRKSTRYFKLRAAVVGTWLLLAGVTLFAACPPSGPRNGLGAEARLDAENLLGAQVYVKNGSDAMWNGVKLTLDTGWVHEAKYLRAGEHLVLGAKDFARDGATAPKDLGRPGSVTLEVEGDKVVLPLGRKKP